MCRHGKSCRLNKGSWGDEGGRLWPPMRTVWRERFKGVDNCWWWLPFLDVRAEWYGSCRRQKPDNLSWPLYAKIKPETLFYLALGNLCPNVQELHQLLKDSRLKYDRGRSNNLALFHLSNILYIEPNPWLIFLIRLGHCLSTKCTHLNHCCLVYFYLGCPFPLSLCLSSSHLEPLCFELCVEFMICW